MTRLGLAGMAWLDLTWLGFAWLAWFGSAWHGFAKLCLAWQMFGLAWPGLAWICFGFVPFLFTYAPKGLGTQVGHWLGSAWLGLACLGLVYDLFLFIVLKMYLIPS